MALANEIETTAAARLAEAVAVDGSTGRCRVPSRAAADAIDAARALADAAHFLSSLHARHPGVIDLAALKPGAERARDWFAAAVAGFEGERSYLTRLIVAAGPVPSTPGQASAMAALGTQRAAIELLARSDRAGCALGAAVALVLDWQSIRTLLDAVALRFDVPLQPYRLPTREETLAAAERAAATPAIERAMLFGAAQLLAQHRHMWDLLDTRATVRATG